MKVVVQRVKQAHVEVESNIVGRIGNGMLILSSVGKEDTVQDADYLVNKLLQLRMFADDKGKMNCSALDTKAEILIVSQFTLHGDCNKGRRPSFDMAADPQKAEELYNYFVGQFKKHNVKVETGQFRAMMEVSLINDGPVTFILDSR
jgi:D-aminoacyl-tRNA deacylase